MISIITATYNRAYILTKLYESLSRQSDFNFEWIIIDDGSTDNTMQLVSKWKPVNFKILYKKQINGGKHRAVNRAVRLAKGDYIFIVDSDDYLLENTIQVIMKMINDIKDTANIAAVSGEKIYPSGYHIGTFPSTKSSITGNILQAKKLGIQGDKAEIYKKDILLKYPFHEFEGENFIQESSVWNLIAKDGYLIRWYNIPIYVCQYLPDGLTKSNLLAEKNFMGYSYTEKTNIYYKPFPENYIAIARYLSLAKKKGYTGLEVKKMLKLPYYKLFLGKIVSILRSIFKYCHTKSTREN